MHLGKTAPLCPDAYFPLMHPLFRPNKVEMRLSIVLLRVWGHRHLKVDRLLKEKSNWVGLLWHCLHHNINFSMIVGISVWKLICTVCMSRLACNLSDRLSWLCWKAQSKKVSTAQGWVCEIWTSGPPYLPCASCPSVSPGPSGYSACRPLSSGTSPALAYNAPYPSPLHPDSAASTKRVSQSLCVCFHVFSVR